MKCTSKPEDWITEDKLTLLRAWARDGMINTEIIKKMGITESTLYLWKKKYPQIEEALRKGKEIVDYLVEDSLLKKALGFYEKEEQVVMVRRVEFKDGKKVLETSDPVVVNVKKYYPPETLAIIYWCKNRRPDKWRDKVVDAENEQEIKNAKDMLIKIRKVASNE